MKVMALITSLVFFFLFAGRFSFCLDGIHFLVYSPPDLMMGTNGFLSVARPDLGTSSVFQTSRFSSQKFTQTTCYYESRSFRISKGLFNSEVARDFPVYSPSDLMMALNPLSHRYLATNIANNQLFPSFGHHI
jgi:hypothetical protein